MDRTTSNRIAAALALVAVLASVASLGPLPGTFQAGLAVLGFATLVAAVHTVQPRGSHTDHQDGALPHLLAAIAVAFVGALALLLVAATAARFGGVRYLGRGAVYLSENFTLVVGPFQALLAGAVLAAAGGRMVRTRQVEPTRRVASLVVLSLLTIAAAAVAGGMVGKPWQAPYLLGLAGVVAWLDATRLAGLPTPRDIGDWLERGDTRYSRQLMRALARAGNGFVVVLGLAAAVLFGLGFTSYGLLVLAFAATLLTAATHAAAGLTQAVPAELEGEVAGEDERSRLRLLGVGPPLVTLVAAALTAAAGAALATPGLAAFLKTALPVAGVGVAILAGLNLARSGLPSFSDHTPLRRAVATTTASLIAASFFFALLVELGVMAGPITDVGAGLLFTYSALLGLGAFVTARGLYPIPGMDIEDKPGDDAEASTDDAAELERSLMAVYVVSGLFVVAAMGLLAMIMLGEMDVWLPQTGEGRNAAFLATVGVGVTLLVGLAVVFVRSRQLETPHEDSVDFERDYTPEEVLRLTVLGISGTLAFVLATIGVLIQVGQIDSLAGFAIEKRFATDFFVFAILIGIGPAGYLHNREKNRVQAIDERLPEFLRDLAESQRTGMTLTQAVITAAEGNYGALTPEIEKMAAQIEWGVSFDRALSSFAERVDTPLVQRTVSLVIEASTSGGNVMDVLEAAAEDAREIQQIKHERKSGMQIYVMIIYIAFLVFIGVIGVLNVKFMPEVAKAVSGAEGVSVGSITFEEFDIQVFRTLFFHAAIIQGLGGGFVAGSMEEGRPSAGLKHAFAMTMIGYLAFRLLLGG